MLEIGILNIFQGKSRPKLLSVITYLNIIKLNAIHMPYVETIRRSSTEHTGLRISILVFSGFDRGLFGRSTAGTVNLNIAQLNILDVVAGNTADNGTVGRFGIVGHNITNY